MRLGIKMLDSSSTLNRLIYLDEVYIYPGETTTVYMQLFDEIAQHRYVPAIGSVVNVKMYANDDANIISKSASNPFSDDRSIWSFNLNASETSKMAGVNFEITLTEGTNIRKTFVKSAIIVYPKSPYQA